MSLRVLSPKRIRRPGRGGGGLETTKEFGSADFLRGPYASGPSHSRTIALVDCRGLIVAIVATATAARALLRDGGAGMSGGPNLPAEEADRVRALRQLRALISARIDADIELLNQLDGDPELEDDDPGGGDVQDEPHDALDEGDAEPSYGSLEVVNQGRWAQGNRRDMEPSLGSLTSTITCGSQAGWSGGGTSDREDDDDREPDVDDEPTLGWTEDGRKGDGMSDGELEPSLGSLGGTASSCDTGGQLARVHPAPDWSGGANDDREHEDEREPEDWL